MPSLPLSITHPKQDPGARIRPPGCQSQQLPATPLEPPACPQPCQASPCGPPSPWTVTWHIKARGKPLYPAHLLLHSLGQKSLAGTHVCLHSISTSTIKGNLNMPALWTTLHSFPVPCLKMQARPDGVGVRQTQGIIKPVLLLSRGSLDQPLLKSTMTHPSHATDGNNCPEQHGESHSMVEVW